MWIKRFGVKTAMFQQTVWASMRNVCQIVALRLGAGVGKHIITVTQLFNVLGSGGGYLLAANAFVAALVEAEERTSQFGVLSGVGMLGNAAGYTCEPDSSTPSPMPYFRSVHDPSFWLLRFFLPYLTSAVGGLVDSYYGHVVPVEITFILLVSVTIFGSLFLPYIAPTPPTDSKETGKPKSGFLTPLKLFMPRRGNMSLFLLGLGAFFSVLATG